MHVPIFVGLAGLHEAPIGATAPRRFAPPPRADSRHRGAAWRRLWRSPNKQWKPPQSTNGLRGDRARMHRPDFGNEFRSRFHFLARVQGPQCLHACLTVRRTDAGTRASRTSSTSGSIQIVLYERNTPACMYRRVGTRAPVACVCTSSSSVSRWPSTHQKGAQHLQCSARQQASL
eukprot:COSAG02_NODE_1694_length_11277_cov_36.084855_7_plen_175_part_00